MGLMTLVGDTQFGIDSDILPRGTLEPKASKQMTLVEPSFALAAGAKGADVVLLC